MHDISINLHMHTLYSDGYGTHKELAQAAIRAGLDAIIVTDHNIWVQGIEGYHKDGEDRVLVLIGEEVHDQARQTQKNHLLVFGADQEMAAYAPDPQNLIDRVKESDGLAFIAHPVDPEAPLFNEDDLSWVSWELQGFTGIELWNAMSEFKSLLTSYPNAIKYAFSFENVAHGPFPETLKLWDELLALGKPVVAVGGSDAHQMPAPHALEQHGCLVQPGHSAQQVDGHGRVVFFKIVFRCADGEHHAAVVDHYVNAPQFL